MVLAAAVAPRALPSVPVAETAANCACRSDALLPSTWSAFRPVATPWAFVVNGAAFALLELMVPTSGPLDSYSKASPCARLLARMHGSLPLGVPPAPERQP